MLTKSELHSTEDSSVIKMQAVEPHSTDVGKMQDEESKSTSEDSSKDSNGEIVEPEPRKTVQKIPVKTEEKGNNSSQNFVRRHFSRHLRIHGKTERQNKMVQTFITGNFFVNTSNIYPGELVE